MSAPVKGDIFGRSLNTGDLVVIRARGYRALILARVIKCTAKRIRIQRVNDDGSLMSWEEQVAMAVFILKSSEATPETMKLLAQRLRENDT